MFCLEFPSIGIDRAGFQKLLNEWGVIYFRNAPLVLEDFLATCRRLGEILRDGSAAVDGITRIIYNASRAAQPGGEGYSQRSLFPHTDRSGTALPPRLLVNLIVKQAGRGGQSTFVRAKDLIHLIKTNYPELHEILCQKDIAGFRRGDHLQMAPIISTQESGQPTIRFRYDNGLYASKSLIRYLATLESAIDNLIEERAFVAGEGYILDNHRVLHGRREFIGDRETWRVLLK